MVQFALVAGVAQTLQKKGSQLCPLPQCCFLILKKSYTVDCKTYGIALMHNKRPNLTHGSIKIMHFTMW